MRIKKGFINRNICGESVLLATGQDNIDFTNIISLNETADFLWKKLSELDAFDIEDMVKLITSEYEVDEVQATTDCKELIQKWTDAGLLEGDDLPPVSPKAKECNTTEDEKGKSDIKKKHKKGFLGKFFNSDSDK